MPPSVFEGYAGRRPGEGEDGRKEPPERPLLLWALRFGGDGGIPESASGRDRKAAFSQAGSFCGRRRGTGKGAPLLSPLCRAWAGC